VINFKDPKDQIPSALALVGIGGLVVSCVNLFFFKAFDKKTLTRKTKAKQEEYETRIKRAKAEFDVEKSRVALRLWNGKVDNVTPAALAKLTTMSETNKVTLVSFRPQKPSDSTVLIQQPYVLTVDGPFTNVANLVNSIENSDAKLAVNQVQMAATEGESDVVTAQIALVAYLDKEEIESKSKVVTKPNTPLSPNTTKPLEVKPRA
jgi:Tfp pilus assembly protein PilO